ncbi:MAG: FAD:protein FMN transferase [Candidatus Gracilibacteria bacterium]|nr:FAD:protein FMN transferase [Candidatus Gracilibacteria bacterium]
MYCFDLDIIGTHLLIRLESSSPTSVDEDFLLIEKRLKDFEQNFSRFIPGNWLHNLNISRKGILDEDAVRMLSFALKVAQKTDGYFDPTIGKRLRDLGYGNRETEIRKSENIFDDILSSSETKGGGDYRDIFLQEKSITLGKDIELEFGGVGKGYLIDVLKEILEKYPRFLINFGGDLFGRGGWKVGLESPFSSEEIVGTYILDESFLACSAGTKRKWGNSHHLVNPKTGESAKDVVATYIEGTSGICVDSYATALSVMPWEMACEMLENIPEIEGVLVRYDGTFYQSKMSKSELFL